MPRYVVLARDFDFADMARRALIDEGPDHVLRHVCDRLGAQVISPSSSERPNAAWRLAFRALSAGYSTPGVWAVAHSVARRIRTGDLVYATGEDLGLTIILLTMLRLKKPALVVAVYWPERTAPTRFLLWFMRRIERLVAISEDKALQVRRLGGLADRQVAVLPSVFDQTFFSPKKPDPPPPVPLIVSGGLVDRDYVTLATAVDGLDVKVEVCAMSSMPASLASPAYPARLPSNMTIGSQSLKELRDMYRAATLTVVPLVANNMGSGLTVVWEAMACGCPVLATASSGDLAHYAEKGLIIGLKPEDPAAVRQAITAALADPEGMAAMTQRARAFVKEQFNGDRYVDGLTKVLLDAEAGRSCL